MKPLFEPCSVREAPKNVFKRPLSATYRLCDRAGSSVSRWGQAASDVLLEQHCVDMVDRDLGLVSRNSIGSLQRLASGDEDL